MCIVQILRDELPPAVMDAERREALLAQQNLMQKPQRRWFRKKPQARPSTADSTSIVQSKPVGQELSTQDVQSALNGLKLPMDLPGQITLKLVDVTLTSPPPSPSMWPYGTVWFACS